MKICGQSKGEGVIGGVSKWGANLEVVNKGCYGKWGANLGEVIGSVSKWGANLGGVIWGDSKWSANLGPLHTYLAVRSSSNIYN